MGLTLKPLLPIPPHWFSMSKVQLAAKIKEYENLEHPDDYYVDGVWSYRPYDFGRDGYRCKLFRDGKLHSELTAKTLTEMDIKISNIVNGEIEK